MDKYKYTNTPLSQHMDNETTNYVFHSLGGFDILTDSASMFHVINKVSKNALCFFVIRTICLDNLTSS